MSSFLERIEAPLMKVAGKLGQQPHLNAIRDGVVGALPLLLIGSLFVLITNPPIPDSTLESFRHAVVFGKPIYANLLIMVRVLIGLVGIYVTFGVANSLARRRDLDALTAGLLAVAALLLINGMPIVMKPPQIPTNAPFLAPDAVVPMANLGSGGLFLGIIIGLLVPEVMRLAKKWKLEISMPAGVPPAVGRSFSALIPGLLVLLPLWIIVYLFGVNLFQVVTVVLTNPIIALSQSGTSLFVVLLVLVLVDSILWLLGVHAVAILAPVSAVWLDVMLRNTTSFSLGKPLELNTRETMTFFIWLGGSGATIMLPFLLMRAKSVSLRAIAKVSAIPAIFNINEPLIFGVPVMMNVTLAIPFILAPIVTLSTTMLATSLGLVPIPHLLTPWTLPGPIGAFFATGGAWQAAVLSLVNIALAGLIYWPFVDALDKRVAMQEAEAAAK